MRIVFAAILFALTSFFGCKGGDDPAGTEGGACYPNDTCNDGLECRDGVCVDPDNPGGIDAGVDGSALPPIANGQFVQMLTPTPELDVLFVVDDSGSMQEEQDQLGADFSFFIDMLGLQGLPDLHIGVISADMGVAPYNLASCSGSGDGGALQSSPQGECTPPSDAYISDVAAQGGGRTTNYTGTLTETFACIARLGTTGCGFEQTLASIEAALSTNPNNAGFLRDDAFLAIITVTDEDDCSATDPAIFNPDPSLDTIDSALGPLSSYRCFDFGIVCNETDPDPVQDRLNVGLRTGCESNESSAYLRHVGDHLDFLRELKGGRPLIWSTAIHGPGSHDGVEGNASTELVGVDEDPLLSASCSSDFGDAAPAFRIAAVSQAFGYPMPQSSICSSSYKGALEDIARRLISILGGQCLATRPSDLGAADGLQTDCRLDDVADGGRGASLATLPDCAIDDSGPCFALVSNPTLCVAGPQLEVRIDRKGGSAPAGSVPVIRCTPEP